jgi:hypothetical protein
VNTQLVVESTNNTNNRVSESPPLSSKSEWTSVLHLSHTWNFPSMRSLAVRHLFSLTTPVDRVVLVQNYDIEHWLRPAYQAICEREEWLSEQEGERLGLRAVLKIGHVRQLLRAPAVLKEAEERGALLDGVFGGRSSSTADDRPPSRLALASGDGPVHRSFNASSSVYTEHMQLSGESEGVSVPEVTAATRTIDASDDASDRGPTDDHYETALGPVYAPFTSSLRDQLLRAVSKIDSAEEAMTKARVDQQTAEQTQAAATAENEARCCNRTIQTLIGARKALAQAQNAAAAAKKCLKDAYKNFVVTVSPCCPSLAKSYRITPEARTELVSLLTNITSAEHLHAQSAHNASQVEQHIEYCRAREGLCARIYATSRTKEDEGSLRRAQVEARAAVASVQDKKEREKHAQDMLASSHLALAMSLSKLIADSPMAHEESAPKAV